MDAFKSRSASSIIKSLSIFTGKIILLLCLLFFICFSYFILLISVEEKSFPFLTSRVKTTIQENLEENDNIRIGNIRIEYKKFNINATIDEVNLTSGKSFIEIPQIELVFSIFDLLMFQNIPKNINIDNINLKNHSYLQNKETQNTTEIFKLSDILPNLINSNLKNINIGNLSIRILGQDKDIYSNNIKEIKLNKKRSIINILATTQINNKNITLTTKCFLEKIDSICNILIPKTDIKDIITLNKSLNKINFLDAKFTSNIIIKSNKNISNIIAFILKSNNGSIDNDKIFPQKTNFWNLKISGQYIKQNNSLIFDDIVVDFANQVKFSSQIKIDNLFDDKYELDLQLKNVTRQDLPKLWPEFIPNDKKIKLWILKHIKSLNIDDSDIKIILNNGKLEDIKANFTFQNTDIIYDRYFPAIYNGVGQAFFDKKSMQIKVKKANLLQSKVSNAIVKIDDFFHNNLKLDITGKVTGSAEDSLKHIGYNSDFARNIGNYFNGNAQSDVKISIPLATKPNINNFSLKIASNIQNFNNKYINQDSNIKIEVNKKENSTNFHTKIDLTKSYINFLSLISKDKNIKSTLTTNIAIEENLLNFNDLKLTLGEEERADGSLVFNLNKKEVKSLKIKHNDFNFSYEIDNIGSSRNLLLTGKKIDIAKIKSIFQSQNNDKLYKHNHLEIILDQIILENDIILNDIDINIHCSKAVCVNSFAHAKMGSKPIFNIDFKPYPIKNITKIKAKIDNLPIILSGLNIYNKMILGNINIDATMKMQKEIPIVIGEIYNKSNIKILKGEMVRKISEDNFFSNIKDKLALDDKVTFDNLKSDFILAQNDLKINKFIISNNFLGLTAKGNINLFEETIDIKGLIVPGYFVNRLFGIGDLPILEYVSPIILGESGGGIFASNYQLQKESNLDTEAKLTINKASVFAPGVIRNFFN